MIAEIGLFALIIALIIALLQGSLPLWGAACGDRRLMGVAPVGAWLQFIALGVAFAMLTTAYVVSDFTVLNVVENSHSAKPLLYKISGVWGNHEGSMLLWVVILALFGVAVAWFGSGLPRRLYTRVLSVQGLISLGFLSFIVLTSNPFIRVPRPPLDGTDLNPLLQDPGLAFHPPMLYLGYVGLSVAFSFAIAALIEGRVDSAWARWVRPWTLMAWVFLTGGIALGSWWAYYELGWGGWWFWDPVENVSFMPWLMATALLHSSIVVEKRDSLKVWTILLAILAFSLSLIGTFIVRSGLLSSVHAFAVNPTRGIFILFLLAVTVGGALALFAWRAPYLKSGGFFAPISREGGILLNNLILSTATATVFLGTLYPLLLEAFGGGRVSVGPPFYNATFVPLMLPLLTFVCVGAMMPWKRGDVLAVLGRLKLAGLVTFVAVLVGLFLSGVREIYAVFGLILVTWLFFGTLAEWAERIKLFSASPATVWQRMVKLPGSAWGMTLAHLGLAVVVAGMIGSTAWKEEAVASMTPGKSLILGEKTYLFKGIEKIEGPNYQSAQARFDLMKDGVVIAELTPEKRVYNVQAMPTTEAAIRSRFWGDDYLALGDQDSTGAWVVRVYREPLVQWIWIGCLLLMTGGLCSLMDRRIRLGAPAVRTRHKTSTKTTPQELLP